MLYTRVYLVSRGTAGRDSPPTSIRRSRITGAVTGSTGPASRSTSFSKSPTWAQKTCRACCARRYSAAVMNRPSSSRSLTWGYSLSPSLSRTSRWAAVASALSIALLMGCAYWYRGRDTSTISAPNSPSTEMARCVKSVTPASISVSKYSFTTPMRRPRMSPVRASV